MPYPHDGPPWTPQHTRALFRVFRTSAPPDFQRQILERVARRQHARVRRRMGWRSPLSWWSGGHAWGGVTLQRHRRWPRRSIATAGCCGLVLGTSVVWWALRTDPAVPSLPEVRMSRTVSLLPRDTDVSNAAPMGIGQHGGFGSVEQQVAARRPASSPAPIDIARQILAGKAVERHMAFEAGDTPERTLPVSAPVPHLTAQKERYPPARLHPQRWRRTRGTPGKGARFHPRPGSSQQTPG